MNKTKIEWCDSTWNPVTGCLHGCEYCYARKIATRFGGTIQQMDLSNNNHDLKEPMYAENNMGKITKAPYPYDFAPTFHRYHLNDCKLAKKPKTIFVCSMADLFGDWVPDEWIQEVFKACEVAPQHNYMFLTKNPQRYCKLANAKKLPKLDNFWYGSTITKPGDCMFAGSIRWNTFLSIEPLLEPLDVGIGSFGGAKSIMIGAETGNRAEKVKPECAWIKNIVEAARLTQAAIFMKDSLLPIVGEENMRREFPWDKERS